MRLLIGQKEMPMTFELLLCTLPVFVVRAVKTCHFGYGGGGGGGGGIHYSFFFFFFLSAKMISLHRKLSLTRCSETFFLIVVHFHSWEEGVEDTRLRESKKFVYSYFVVRIQLCAKNSRETPGSHDLGVARPP